MADLGIMNGFHIFEDRFGAFYEKNKAHIFTGLGITGTIATGILSAKDGARAARKIDRREKELGRSLNWKEKTQLCWKDYIDAGLMCGIACFSEFKSDQINTRTIADRTALLIASEQAYDKLSKKTREVLGEKKARQVEDEIAKEKAREVVTDEKLEEAPRMGNGTLYPFVDEFSGFLFWSNIDYIKYWVLKLQGMMKDCPARGGNDDYDDKPMGVHYSEWLSAIGAPNKMVKSNVYRKLGWNRGFDPDGIDDDPIEYYTTTMEYKEGFAVEFIFRWN